MTRSWEISLFLTRSFSIALLGAEMMSCFMRFSSWVVFSIDTCVLVSFFSRQSAPLTLRFRCFQAWTKLETRRFPIFLQMWAWLGRLFLIVQAVMSSFQDFALKPTIKLTQPIVSSFSKVIWRSGRTLSLECSHSWALLRREETFSSVFTSSSSYYIQFIILLYIP